MIRLGIPDRETAEQLVTALNVAAGLIPAPVRPDPAWLPLANDLAAQVGKLPPAPEVEA